MSKGSGWLERHTLEFGSRELGFCYGYVPSESTNLRVHANGHEVDGKWFLHVEFFVIKRDYGVEERKSLAHHDLQSTSKEDILARADGIIEVTVKSWCQP